MSPTDPAALHNRALPRVLDTLLFLGAIFWLVLATVNVPGGETPDGEATDLAVVLWLVGILAWGTIFVRRRLPIVTLSAGLLLAVIGLEYLLLLFGVYHAAVTWRPPARTWLGWIALATIVLFWVREAFTPFGDQQFLTPGSNPQATIIASSVIALLSLGVTFGMVVLTRSRRQATQERARADVEHTHAARLGKELSRQSERAEIAREIHDGLTNRLALISMMSGNLDKAVRAEDPDAPALALDIQSQARNALNDLRSLISDLRTEPSAPATQLASMSSLGELISATRAAGTKLDALVLVNGPYNVHPELDAAVFRLVQESITNAVKHAPGEALSLYLDAGPTSGVRLRMSNPLPQMDMGAALSGAKFGTGLTGMRERVSDFGGTIWAGENDGEFLVDITIPWLTVDSTFPVPDTSATLPRT